jgi:hypothetical protein
MDESSKISTKRPGPALDHPRTGRRVTPKSLGIEIEHLLEAEPFAGMHRWVWDLRYPSPPAILHNYGMATVAGRTYRQPLTVKMDPRVKTPMADLAKQHDLGLKIWQALQDNWQALQ